MTKKKILIIDDEPEILDIMRYRISSWGYDVIEAQSGEEALEALKNSSPDAVIIDYLMPDIDGIALLKKIRGINKDIPAIMFTAYPEHKAMEDAEKLDIAGFIPKISPYTNTIDALKKLLEMTVKK